MRAISWMQDLSLALRMQFPVRLRRRPLLAQFRERWKTELVIERKFPLIEKYYQLTRSACSGEPLDDQTWSDMDMDGVFCKLDRNVSSVGRQYLYRMLRYSEDDEAILKERTRQYDILTNDAVLSISDMLALLFGAQRDGLRRRLSFGAGRLRLPGDGPNAAAPAGGTRPRPDGWLAVGPGAGS